MVAATGAIGVLLAAAATAGATNVFPSFHHYGTQRVGATSPAAQFQLGTSPTFCGFYDPSPPACGSWAVFYTETTPLGGPPGTTVRSGAFLVHNLSCPYSLMYGPPNDYGSSINSCSFEATFAPKAAGTSSKSLTFSDSHGVAATLTLTGLSARGTGGQAAVVKKCRKKFRKGSARRKKCLRGTRQLPG